jgi:hypothetical protein
MSNRIKHMGMTLTKDEHEKWHREHPQGISPEEHDALMKRLGITKEQDEEWHRGHATPREAALPGGRLVNIMAIGGAFVGYCVKEGWLIQHDAGRKTRYYVTPEGERELKTRFGIKA